MPINWDAVGAVGEIIGAVAVFVTLVYLARQIRQSNKLMRFEAKSVFLESRKSALQGLYSNDKLIESIVRARKNEHLDEVEQQRLDLYYRSVFVLWDWEFSQYRAGLLDESPIKRFRDASSYYPLFADSWSAHKNSLSSEFAQFMETEIFDKRFPSCPARSNGGEPR